MKRKAVAVEDGKKKKFRQDREERCDDDDDEASHQLLGLCEEGFGGDVCKALMDRYARSSAPQHRHLCASSAAMRSILQEEGLPLTPPAYFAAAITAIRDAPDDDPDAFAALSAFLSIVLPLVPEQSLAPAKAKDAAFVLSCVLKEQASVATGTARSIVKSLGAMLLRLDMDDWNAFELPLQTLLVFASDRRPKVRRCAQICIEKVFKALASSKLINKASNIMLSTFKKYIPLARQSNSCEPSDLANHEELTKPEHFEVIQTLILLKLTAQNLCDKVRVKILSELHGYLGSSFSSLTRHILGLVEVLVDYTEINIIVEEMEKIISALSSFLSTNKKIPRDSIIPALGLLRKSLSKVHDVQPSLWLRKLPDIFIAVKGYMHAHDNISENASNIIKELINYDINWNALLTTASRSSRKGKQTPEETAVVALCSLYDTMLDNCDTPTEYILAAISALFIKFGDFSYIFMKDILLKLSKWAMKTGLDQAVMILLQDCIGSAVISMGPTKVLSLIPISLNAKRLNCSNAWLIPILKRYVVGASLHFFMEHIWPLANNIQDACTEVKNVTLHKNLQSCARGLRELLPTFCHYPADTSQSFESLTKLLVDALREDPSLHEIISLSLQVLVYENISILDEKQGQNLLCDLSTSSMIQDLQLHSKNFPVQYKKETASENIKVLSCNSINLIQVLTDVFLILPPEQRAYPKEAVRCLASLAKNEDIHIYFSSLLENHDLQKIPLESEELDEVNQKDASEDDQRTSEVKEKEDNRNLVIELAAAFVGKADPVLIDAMFSLIRSSLSDNDVLTRNGLFTLSIILKEHSWFCLSRTGDIIDMLHNVKISEDNVVLKNQLSCYHILLVQILKRNEEKLNMKAFLILNEIILKLKSKKQSRKIAYDAILEVCSSLKDSQPDKGESAIQLLITMVMGYLSSSSPHVISGAISALSLLIYHDIELCLTVPNLVASVLALLPKKDIEVTKAALGFVKVLVTSLLPDDLMKLKADILSGILPWSSTSKWHFRSKVGLILEIMIRKCSFDPIVLDVPEKYKGFVKDVHKGLQSKKMPFPVASSETRDQSTDPLMKRSKQKTTDYMSDPKKKHEASLHVKRGNKRKYVSNKDGINKSGTPVVKEDRQKSWKNASQSKSKRNMQPSNRSASKSKRRKVDKKPDRAGSKGNNKMQRDMPKS